MASLDHQFRTLLHTHLDRSDTSGRRFGAEALGDPGFVASLAKGRRLGLKTADRVLAFIGLTPLAPAFRREVEAFLRLTGTKVYVLGEGAVGDPSFIERLRRDASFRLGTVERVRGWMACRADAAALAAMRDAVAGVPLLSDGEVTSGECGPQGDHDMKQDDGNHLSTRRAAAFLGLSPRTLDRYRVTGEGPVYHRFGNRILYRRDDLEAWAGGQGRRTPAPPRPRPHPLGPEIGLAGSTRRRRRARGPRP